MRTDLRARLILGCALGSMGLAAVGASAAAATPVARVQAEPVPSDGDAADDPAT
jgi:hypothetical protein